MILQSLNELYDRLAADERYGISPPGFSPQKISFRVVISEDGSLFAIEDARIMNRKGNLEAFQQEVPAHEKRTSGIKAQFLCDKIEYILGYQPEGKREKIGIESFEEFREKHLALEYSIGSPAFSSLCKFLATWNPEDLENHTIGKEFLSGFGYFQIKGERKGIHEDPAVKSWWIDHCEASKKDGHLEQCLVSGKITPICRIHPDIKGFKSSIALVGIQENTSYESYGRSKTENCPISKDVAFGYATALNSLLAGPLRSKHRLSIGSTTVVFWTAKPSVVEDYFAEFIGTGSIKIKEVQDETRLRSIELMLKAVRRGAKFVDSSESETPFFILGIEQPNPGRFSVRFFHRSTIYELLEKLHAHHQDMEIIREFEEPKGKRQADPEFPAIWQLLIQTARVSDEIPPLLGGALTRAIIAGTMYPEGLYAATLRRIRADRTVNYFRATILKAVLVRNHKKKIPIMLDTTENTDPAYRLGRLFASLEKIQEEGHFEQTGSKLDKTIRERYFSSAAATPASVMPRLEQLSTHHRRHLKAGRKAYFDRLIGDIKWPESPKKGTKKTHTLEEQGLFILGYYHQRKDFFTSKKEADEFRKPATLTTQ